MHFTDYDTRLAVYALIVDEHDRILLTWWNGEGVGEPGWTLPGGGVEFEESLGEAVVREVHEETGYEVEVGAVVADHVWQTLEPGRGRSRPFKALRVVFDAAIVGGRLGTLEIGGSTDHAEWVPLADVVGHVSRSTLVDLGVSAHLRRAGRERPDR